MSRIDWQGYLKFDREAETSTQRLVILIVVGALLVATTFWLFSGDDEPPQLTQDSPAPPIASSPDSDQAPPIIDPVVEAPPPVPQLVLHGVSGYGENGAAIISVGGSGQRLVRTGRPIAPGVTLVAVAANHVLIEDRGSEIRLAFPEGGATTAATGQPSAGAPAARNSFERDALEYQAALRAHEVDGEFMGYRIAGTVPADLSAAGLQTGDVIVRFGATRLEGPDDVERIPRELAASDSVIIRYRRNGAERTATIETR